MATPEQIKAIAGLYVAYFDRAPDPAGLEFWINQLDNGRDFATISQDFADSPEAQQIYPFLATPDVSGQDPTNLITSIYQNLFGREPEAQGLNFWVNVVNSGAVAVGDMVEAVMMGAQDAVVNGELVLDKTTVENRIECALEFAVSTSNIPGFVFDTQAYNVARAVVDGIDASQASVDEAKLVLAQYLAGEGTQAGSTFTLCPHVIEVSPEIVETQLVTNKVLYWGYNPHLHGEEGVDNTAEGNTNNLTNEGPADGGIPASEFFGVDGYLTQMLNVGWGDLFRLLGGSPGGGNPENIDPDAEWQVPDFGNLEEITIGDGGILTFGYSDGTSDDVAIAAEYIDFVTNLIFDSENNTRFFEKDVAADVPVYLDEDGNVTLDSTAPGAVQIGRVDAVLTTTTDAVYATIPPILTPSVNNGGTFEPGFTDQGNTLDDLIVAGTLDLLHTAIIDGGLGYNTLEIDAKGHFAQPKSLINIQQISIENLPNVYTGDPIDGPSGTDNASQYPDVIEDDDPDFAAGDADSVIDLTRARDLQNVTITEGGYDPLDAANNTAGDLWVVGLRNNATLTLQGGFFDGDVYVETSEGFTANGFTVILDNVNAENTMYIADNGPTLNLVSQGGGNYFLDLDEWNNGAVRDLNISGDAYLFIESDLEQIFDADTPGTINASENTGGVDLNMDGVEQVTFIGSKADDRFAVDTSDSTSTEQGPDFDNDQSVDIFNTVGDNYYDIDTHTLTLKDGDGDINVEFDIWAGTIELGDGDNHVEGFAANLVATAGDGDNKFDVRGYDADQLTAWTFEDDYPTLIDLTAGDGSNIFNVYIDPDNFWGGHFLAAATVNITAGNGGNLIQIPALPYDEDGVLSTVTVNTGAGNDTMFVGGSTITINSGGGNDTITLVGIDNDYVTEVSSITGGNYNYKGFIPSIYGAEINIDTGAGSATINLGAYLDNAFLVTGALVAKEGSSITGNDITLFVNTDADLRAATLDGITAIIMDDDNRAYSGQGYSDGDTNPAGAASLTLLDTQVAQLLADGVDFSTQGETFGAQSIMTIVITGDVVLGDLIDFATWNDSIKLCFVVEDGASLTMTAEQLHYYVAPEGIAVDEQNGYIDNQVIITNAGPDFNAYGDQYEGTGAGTVAGSVPMQDVTVLFTEEGFERPSQDGPVNLIQWNSDDDNSIDVTIYPFATDLEITGAADLSVNNPIILGDAFTIDFSDFTGDFAQTVNGVSTLTVANFQDITPNVNLPANIPNNNVANPFGGPETGAWGRIDGNGTEADPVRINMLVVDGTSTGDQDLGVANGGFFSSGVQQYVLTGFHTADFDLLPQSGSHSADIVVCDQTEDLEVLGLQNNRNAEVTFWQVNWGTEILLEGDGYANSSDQEKNLGNPDLSEVGCVIANFFEAGANAVVRVTNQGVALGLNEDAEDGYDPTGERKLDVDGIVVNNADRLLIAVEDGDAVIHDVTGIDVERVIVTGPEDVEIVVATIAESVGDVTGFGSLATKGAGFDTDDLKSIDASGVAGTFTLTLTGDADLSGVTLTGIDAICLNAPGAQTIVMTADQLVAVGSLIENKGDMVTLNVVDMGDQPLDLSAIDVDNIGTVTFVDEAVTVDASTDFGDADSLIIPKDSQVTMTVAQFQTADGGDDGEPDVTDGNGTGNAANNKLILTAVPNGEAQGTTPVEEVDLDDVGVDVDVDIVFDNFTANARFDVSAGGGETTTAVISGTTDLSAGDLGTVDCILLQDGAELTLSQAQIQTLLTAAGMGAELSDIIKLAPGATATLNINGIDGTGAALDLNDLVADWGGALDIGTLTIANTNGLVTLPGWTTGGADEIVTPTGSANSPEFGIESTQLTLTMSQFLDLDGIGTITGGSIVNIRDLANTIDGSDTGADPDSVGIDKPNTDTVDIDTSGITARKGVITLIEVGTGITDSGEAVFLTDTSDLSGFEIILTDGQIIGFATEAQASGAVVTESAQTTINGNPTGIVWCFTTWSGTEIDTSGYDSDINTLFVYDTLVDGQNEEAIWSYLPGSIDVQKFNDAIPIGLQVINRVNIFEPFTTAPNGITFDDQDGLQTIGGLTLILEGNVLLGDVTIAETVGDGKFEFIEIFSTFDAENNPADPNVIIQPNVIGDIFLNAQVAMNTVVEVFIDTSDGQIDAAFANGVNAGGSAPGGDTDAGLALVTGTIHLGTPAAGVDSALVALVGDHDITIAGLDYSAPSLMRVDVQTDDFDFTQDLRIGNVNIGDLSTAMGLGGSLDGYVILNNFTATSLTDLDSGMFTPTAGDETIILATDGNVDLTLIGAGDAVFDIDGIHGLAAGTVTLTADQIAAIGTADGPDAGTGADAWILGPGVNPNDITINVYGLSGQVLDLDAVRDAGFNIGTITIIAPGADLDNGTTLGGADQIVIEINDGDGEVTLELSAEQYNQLADGTIVEDRGPGTDPLTDVGTVLIDNVAEIEVTATGEATIDVTNVNTSGNNQFFVRDAFNPSASNDGGADTVAPTFGAMTDNDTTFSAASNLGDFAVTLVDLNSTATDDELAGQTVRFSTEVQADGRVVNVIGADSDANPALNSPTNVGATEAEKDEKDTNVVWLFNTVSGTPGLDVSGYDGHLGRLWVSDELVDSVGGNVDSLFTVDDGGTPDFTLDSDIIKRIETADLDALLQLNVPINQRVEITSFTQIAGAEFTIDDPLVSISTLRMDFGGATDINNLVLDNILGPVDPVNTNFPGDDDFQLLEINSLLANHAGHYLLPDAWTPANPLPSNDVYNDSFENNVVGDISSGPDRGVLHTIRINTFEDDTTDSAPAADESDVNGPNVVTDGPSNVYNSLATGFDASAETLLREGAQFVAETIYFSDDGDTTAVGGTLGTSQATLIITGENDVTVKSLDTSDADITSLVVDLLAYSGTFTVTGGSPAFDGDSIATSTTTSLTITGSASSVATFASTVTTDNDMMHDPDEDFVTYNVGSGNTLPFAGVSGSALEEIDLTAMAGTVSLGVISQVSSEEFTLNAAGAGQVFGCIGRALDDGVEEVPTLSATGVWTVNGSTGGDADFTGANNVDLEIKEVVFTNGGQLSLTNVDLCITGDVDMSVLDVADLFIGGTTTIEVKAGGKLILTVEQVDALGGLVIFGEGTVCVVGESDSTDTSIDTTFGNLQTATVDFSAVTLDAGDDTLEITANGASSDPTGTDLVVDGDRIAQTIIGSANNDAVTVTSSADDSDNTTIDVITRLGADDGDIGVPGETPTTNTPVDATPEEVGDTVTKNSNAQVLVEVDAGYDQVIDPIGLETGDVIQVAAGTEFYAADANFGFVATAETTNDGIAVIEEAGGGGSATTIDVSAAGGANGWTLIGGPDDNPNAVSILIGSDQDDVLVDGLADTADNDGKEDSFTGNNGEDLFQFNVATTTPAEFVTTPIQAARDVEYITVLTPSAADAVANLLTVEYQLNNVTTVAVVNNTTAGFDIDFLSATSIATAIATVLNNINGITAAVDGITPTQVNLVGDNGNLLDINDVTPNASAAGFTWDQAGDATQDDDADNTNDAVDTGDDDLQITDSMITGTVTAGEVYFLTVTLKDGSVITAEFEAGSQYTTDAAGVVQGLISNANGSGINDIAAGAVVASISPADGTGETIRITDGDDDDGGFTLTVSEGQAILSASSASSILPSAPTGAELLADQDADIILDFVEDDDLISFGLAAGSSSNYDEDANAADFGAALLAANVAFAADPDLLYYLTGSDADAVGLLFVNANGDDEADTVVQLAGVDASNFDDSNIV
jgi:hypothetical protein